MKRQTLPTAHLGTYCLLWWQHTGINLLKLFLWLIVPGRVQCRSPRHVLALILTLQPYVFFGRAWFLDQSVDLADAERSMCTSVPDICWFGARRAGQGVPLCPEHACCQG